MQSDDSQARTPVFSGTMRHALDDKHRVTIPARWRRFGAQEFFAIPDPRQPLLILLTELELQRLGGELDALAGLDPVARRSFKRQFFSQAQVCPVDKQGRLVLPAGLCAGLGLQGEVVLVGGGSRIEVWGPDEWEAVCVQEKPGFAEIADKLGL